METLRPSWGWDGRRGPIKVRCEVLLALSRYPCVRGEGDSSTPGETTRTTPTTILPPTGSRERDLSTVVDSLVV